MINGQIRDKEVRVISESGEQLGIMSSKDAMKLAREADLDLVKIAPKAQPPDVRSSTTVSISMSWREKKKKQRRSKKL